MTALRDIYVIFVVQQLMCAAKSLYHSTMKQLIGRKHYLKESDAVELSSLESKKTVISIIKHFTLTSNKAITHK